MGSKGDSGGRAKGAAGVVVGVVVFLLVLGGLNVLRGVSRQRLDVNRMWKELDAINQQSLERMQAANASGQMADVRAIMAESIAKLDAIASRTRGDESTLIRVLGEFMADFSLSVGSYQQAVRPFVESGGMGGLRTADQVVDQRDRLKFARERHKAVKDMLKDASGRLELRLAATGVDRAKWASMHASAASRLADPLLLQVQEVEGELLRQMDDHLAVLQRQGGHWTLRGDQIEFDRSVGEGEVKAFNQRLGLIQMLSKQQTDMQAKVLDRERRRRASGQ